MSNTINNTMIGPLPVTLTGNLGSTYTTGTYSIGSPSYSIGTTGINNNNITWQNGSSITTNPNLNGSTLKVQGNAEIDGDLKVKGKSIVDSLDRIEERLAILRPNEELEAKWENLRGLRNAYMELEAEIKEKEAMWGILKR